MACIKLETVPKTDHLNVYIANALSPLQATAGIVHVQEVLDIIRDSSFHAKLLYAQIASIE